MVGRDRTITVVDYDAGNIRSVTGALAALGYAGILTSDPKALENAGFVILPGVGAFGSAVRSLSERGLFGALVKRLEGNRPTLGICLGMQLMFEYSEESEGAKGFGFFKGGVKRLNAPDLPVPHIGWTTLDDCEGVFKPFEGEHFYFVHGFAASGKTENAERAYSDYGGVFTAAVRRGNIFATQFHPEKSGEVGLALLDDILKAGGAE